MPTPSDDPIEKEGRTISTQRPSKTKARRHAPRSSEVQRFVSSRLRLGRLGFVLVIIAGLIVPTLSTSARVDGDRSIRSRPGVVHDAPDRVIRAGALAAANLPPGVPVSNRRYRELKAAAASGRADLGEVLPGSDPPAPSIGVTTSFGGITRATAGTGNPPDTTLAKSPLRVLEGVNSVLRLTSTSGGLLSQAGLNTFFGASTTQGTLFDPKVYFDRNATNRRFYVVSLQVAGRGDTNAANNFSRIWLAVSRSTDPTSLASTQWCRYFLEGRFNVGTSNESWADYPGLGAGATALAITTNQFRFTAPQPFTFAVIRALNKLTLANNASACPAGSSIEIDRFQASTTLNDGNAFTIQPAQHYTSPSSFVGTANPAYLVSARFGSSTAYRVWRIRNFPGASSLNVVSAAGNFSYSLPPLSPGGVGDDIDTGDTRVLQVAGVGNRVTASHTTGCQFTSGTAESCARIVRFVVGQSSAGGITASVNQQNTFGLGDNTFVSYPGIAVNNALSAAVPFQRSGSGIPLAALATTKLSGSASFGAPVLLGPNGTCALNTGFDSTKGFYRAGDFTGAQTDTDAVGFWLAGERATSIAGLCQWATHVIRATA